MRSRPFGVGEDGENVGRTKGTIISSTLKYMLKQVELRTKDVQAVEEAKHELVRRINEAIADPRLHVTLEYLLNEGNVNHLLLFQMAKNIICLLDNARNF